MTITETVAPEAPATSAARPADHNDTVGHPADGRNRPLIRNTGPEWSVSKVKSNQLKLVAAGIGAGAARRDGRTGRCRSLTRRGIGTVSEGPEFTLGETTTVICCAYRTGDHICDAAGDGRTARRLRNGANPLFAVWRRAGSARRGRAAGAALLRIADVGDCRGLTVACRADDHLVVDRERRARVACRARNDVGLAVAVLASNGDRRRRDRGYRAGLRQQRGVSACAVGHHELAVQTTSNRPSAGPGPPMAPCWPPGPPGMPPPGPNA